MYIWHCLLIICLRPSGQMDLRHWWFHLERIKYLTRWIYTRRKNTLSFVRNRCARASEGHPNRVLWVISGIRCPSILIMLTTSLSSHQLKTLVFGTRWFQTLRTVSQKNYSWRHAYSTLMRSRAKSWINTTANISTNLYQFYNSRGLLVELVLWITSPSNLRDWQRQLKVTDWFMNVFITLFSLINIYIINSKMSLR